MNLYRRIEDKLEADNSGYGPVKGTQSMGRIGMIWLAANLVVTTLLTGTLFIPGATLSTAIWMIVIGTLVGAVVLSLIGNIGTRTGLPTMAITRGAFGIRGSILPVIANLVVLMGWSWVQAMLAGVTINYLIAETTGYSNPVLFSVICQVLVVALAIFGHTGIAKVEPWLALLILAIMGFVFYAAFSQFTIGELGTIPVDAAQGLTSFSVLDIVISTAISWTVLSADFNRYARSSKAGIIGSGVGYSLSTILSMSLGAIAISVVILSGKDAIAFDPITIVEHFGAPLAIAIFLSVMATNTMVVYGMVTTAVHAQSKRKLKFLPTALILGAISVVGATWLDLLNQFTNFLVMIGAFFIPVFAIMIVDYYLLKRSSYTTDILDESAQSRYWYAGGINWTAIVVWVIGAVSSYLLTYLFPTPIGASIPVFALSFLLYWAVSIPGRNRFQHQGHKHLTESIAVVPSER